MDHESEIVSAIERHPAYYTKSSNQPRHECRINIPHGFVQRETAGEIVPVSMLPQIVATYSATGDSAVIGHADVCLDSEQWACREIKWTV